MASYHDPLLWSVHDLRSRLVSITEDDLFGRFMEAGEDRAAYALRHTMFVLAEYLGWVEILRRSVSFIDLGDQRRNQRLMEHLSLIRQVLFARDLDAPLRVLYGYQRAIGELMIVPDAATDGRASRCLGFAQFTALLERDENFREWFSPLEQSVFELAQDPQRGISRLKALESQLAELIDFLDPDRLRFPRRSLERPYYRDQRSG
ncbi:hypothetical protein [Streptomyces longispororuber]|uniref:hypothetical protein n=1 Tax=Streptomyces longispororuber TaxID=68230 RepID=UPI0036F7DA68